MHLTGIGLLATVGQGTNVILARAQMASTLGFHIILACMGIAMPTIVLVSEYIGLRRSDSVALLLARRWSQVLGVLVAVGAVTGTVLSFEMGLLWPGLMSRYGSVLGFPFGVEGIFFFLEAIFTAIYLYGWRHLDGWAHFWSGVPIALSGIFGAMSVIAVNAWMNQPGGFTVARGKITSIDPWQVYFNHASYYEMPHMVLAAYLVAGFMVAAVYAVAYLRGRRDRYHRMGFAIPFVLAAIATPLQIGIGDTAARAIAHDQPIKFAAMEYVLNTARGVPEYLAGVLVNGHVYGAITIPDLDSLLVGFSPNTQVIGLDTVPPADRPPVPWLIHLSFDAMVGISFVLLLAGVWALIIWSRHRRLPFQSLFWRLAVVCGPGAIIAMECGWIVTEVGRQPWVVYDLLTTQQAATTNGGVEITLTGVVILYAVLGVATILILKSFGRRWRGGIPGEVAVPYGPERESRGVQIGDHS